MATEAIQTVEDTIAKRIRMLPINWQLDALRLLEEIQAKRNVHKRLERERRDALRACANMRASAELQHKASEWMAKRKTEWQMKLEKAVDEALRDLTDCELSDALRLIERLHKKYERQTLTIRKWSGALADISGEYTAVELQRKALEWMAQDAANRKVR